LAREFFFGTVIGTNFKKHGNDPFFTVHPYRFPKICFNITLFKLLRLESV
jgi:hypothetical protein